MAGPSQAQIGLLKGIQGLTEGFGGAMDREAQMKRAEMLQQAIEQRQEARDMRQSLPRSLYGPMWEKMTGLPIPEEAPDYLNPTMGAVLLRYPGQEAGNESREKVAGIRARAAGQGRPVDKSKLMADVYNQALEAGALALGGKKGVKPNYASIVGSQRDLFNTAAKNEWNKRMQALGGTEQAPAFLELGTPATEATGAHGLLGFGKPAAPETSRLAAVPWAGPGGTSVSTTSGGDRVAKIIQGYRANKGLNDVQISQMLQKAGVNMSPEQVAQVR